MARQNAHRTLGPTQVGTTNTSIGEPFVLEGRSGFMSVEVENASVGSPLTDFKVRIKTHPDGAWVDYLADGDYDSTDLNDNVLFASTVSASKTTAGTRTQFICQLPAVHAVDFQARVSIGTANVTVRASFSPV